MRPTRQVTPKYNCRACGGCCASKFDEPVHVDVTRADIVRLSKYARERAKLDVDNVDLGSTRHASIPTKHDRHDNCVCMFLRGTLGKRVTCMVYETRPQLCRTFPVDGVSCRESRRALGLPV